MTNFTTELHDHHTQPPAPGLLDVAESANQSSDEPPNPATADMLRFTLLRGWGFHDSNSDIEKPQKRPRGVPEKFLKGSARKVVLPQRNKQGTKHRPIWWTAEPVTVATLSDVRENLESQTDSILVLGHPATGVDTSEPIKQLPVLEGVETLIQFSTGAGFDDDHVRVRLWFVTDKPTLSENVRRFAKAQTLLDDSQHSKSQPHFIVDPEFKVAAENPFNHGGRWVIYNPEGAPAPSEIFNAHFEDVADTLEIRPPKLRTGDFSSIEDALRDMFANQNSAHRACRNARLVHVRDQGVEATIDSVRQYVRSLLPPAEQMSVEQRKNIELELSDKSIASDLGSLKASGMSIRIVPESVAKLTTRLENYEHHKADQSAAIAAISSEIADVKAAALAKTQAHTLKLAKARTDRSREKFQGLLDRHLERTEKKLDKLGCAREAKRKAAAGIFSAGGRLYGPSCAAYTVILKSLQRAGTTLSDFSHLMAYAGVAPRAKRYWAAREASIRATLKIPNASVIRSLDDVDTDAADIVVVHAGHGVGKTEIIASRMIEQYKRTAHVSPRVSLVTDAAVRLGLTHYDSQKDGDRPDFDAIGTALCAPSLIHENIQALLLETDCMVIDEFHSLLDLLAEAHLLSHPAQIFSAFKSAIKSVDKVVVLDADVTPSDIAELTRLAAGKTIAVYELPQDLNEYTFRCETTESAIKELGGEKEPETEDDDTPNL